MHNPKNKHVPVFAVNGSLNSRIDIIENIITPNPNPNNLEGHI